MPAPSVQTPPSPQPCQTIRCGRDIRRPAGPHGHMPPTARRTEPAARHGPDRSESRIHTDKDTESRVKNQTPAGFCRGGAVGKRGGRHQKNRTESSEKRRSQRHVLPSVRRTAPVRRVSLHCPRQHHARSRLRTDKSAAPDKQSPIPETPRPQHLQRPARGDRNAPPTSSDRKRRRRKTMIS